MSDSLQYDDLKIGSIIADKYRIEKLLGQGGMGQVYLVAHTQLDKYFALKVMRLEGAKENSKDLVRFNREAKVLAKLSHPNIIMVVDFGITQLSKLPYIVMEYIDGVSLRSFLEEKGTLSESTTTNILKQICAGLGETHRIGIVHRDLKPENIMVQKFSDNQIAIKILDFGIAKLTNNDITQNKLSLEGEIIGTRRYMSPEQCFGSTIDARSDIYSLSVMAYEMLTGKVPNALIGNIKPLTIMRPGITQQLSDIIQKGLAVNADERYQDILQLKKELESCEANSNVDSNKEVLPTKPLDNSLTQPSRIEDENKPTKNSADKEKDKLAIKDIKENNSSNSPIPSSTSKRSLLIPLILLVVSLVTASGFYYIYYYKTPLDKALPETKRFNEDSLQMIIIPSGEFTMGNNKGDIYCKPEHLVQVATFQVSRFLVTNKQYAEFVKSAAYAPPKEWNGFTPDKNILDKPITNISWNDANNYCSWLSKQTNKRYRLISEKEWEYLANFKSKFRVEEILTDYVEWTDTILELYPGTKTALPETLKATNPRVIRGKDDTINMNCAITFRQWQVSDFRNIRLSFRIACDIK